MLSWGCMSIIFMALGVGLYMQAKIKCSKALRLSRTKIYGNLGALLPLMFPIGTCVRPLYQLPDFWTVIYGNLLKVSTCYCNPGNVRLQYCISEEELKQQPHDI